MGEYFYDTEGVEGSIPSRITNARLAQWESGCITSNRSNVRFIHRVHKKRVDRNKGSDNSHAKGWNKSGKKARLKIAHSRVVGALRTKSKRFGLRGWKNVETLQQKFDMKKEFDMH